MLLPWYVNDSLHTDEKNRVESHLKSCIQCRAELLELNKIAQWVCEHDPLSSQAHASFSNLMDKIQQEDSKILTDQEKQSVPVDFKNRIFRSNNKLTIFGYAVFAQAAVVLLGLTLLIKSALLGSFEQPVTQFHTLSDGQQIHLNTNEIRVVFSKNIQEAQINRVVSSLPGKIVSGPSEQGVYVIRIENNKIAESEISELVRNLRKNNQIIFAEPAFSALSPDNSG